MGSDRLATYSSLDNHLLITDLNSGAIIYNEKKPSDPKAIVEGITSNYDDQLCVLSVNTEKNEY